jgi:hypothetical protein
MKFKSWFLGLSKTKKILFCTGSFILVCFVLFVARLLYSHGTVASQVLFYDVNDTYMDFYNSVYDAADRDPYSHGVVYPPLCNLVYWLCSKMVPSEVYFNQPYVFPGGGYIRNFQGAQLAFLLYSAVLGFLIVFSILKICQSCGERYRLFILAVVFSSLPMLYAVERGNIILYAFAFLLVYFVCYNSKNKVLVEIGYICLALSAGIKIYPAIFGIMLLADKRYWAAFRTVLYGLFLFFFPFVFFGGFSAIVAFFNNLHSFSDSITYGISFESVFNYFLLSSGATFPGGSIISKVIAVIMIVAAFFEKSNWKRSALLACAMIGVVSANGKYAAVFLLIPWLYFFLEIKNWRVLDYIYVSIFTLIFAVIPMRFAGSDKLNVNQIFIAFLLLVFSLILIGDSLQGAIKSFLDKKNKPIAD